MSVKHTLAENKSRLQQLAKKRSTPASPPGPKTRESPGGRRLAELRKKKNGA